MVEKRINNTESVVRAFVNPLHWKTSTGSKGPPGGGFVFLETPGATLLSAEEGSMRKWAQKQTYDGFTIVELLIVVVVIAILAAITIIGYNGISQRAKQSAAASAAESAAKKALAYAVINSELLPPDLPTAGVNNDVNTIFEYSYDNTAKTYCITATFQKVSYYVSNTSPTPTAGLCAGHSGGMPGVVMQTLTTANCPITSTRAVDGRDKSTYWIQKLADGKCWMLTNLAYAGGTSNGGANTYNDVMPTGDGSAGTLSGPDNAGANTNTLAKYYIPIGANPTTEPTAPSSSTTGIGQYGYLYNFCAVNGGTVAQSGNGACSSSSSAAVDTTKSICPSGWRLPIGNGGDFTALNTAVNGGANNDAGLIAKPWLGQRSGLWNAGVFQFQGSIGYYWSSNQSSPVYGYVLYFNGSSVSTAFLFDKNRGFAVRCVTN